MQELTHEVDEVSCMLFVYFVFAFLRCRTLGVRVKKGGTSSLLPLKVRSTTASAKQDTVSFGAISSFMSS